MKYYTNVQMVGNDFLVRGYENGKSFTSRESFQPTMFVPSKKRTKYRTLDGKYVQSIKPGTVRETREFIRSHEGVDNFEIYGNCLLYTSPSPRDLMRSRMTSSA